MIPDNTISRPACDGGRGGLVARENQHTTTAERWKRAEKKDSELLALLNQVTQARRCSLPFPNSYQTLLISLTANLLCGNKGTKKEAKNGWVTAAVTG